MSLPAGGNKAFLRILKILKQRSQCKSNIHGRKQENTAVIKSAEIEKIFSHYIGKENEDSARFLKTVFFFLCRLQLKQINNKTRLNDKTDMLPAYPAAYRFAFSLLHAAYML